MFDLEKKASPRDIAEMETRPHWLERTEATTWIETAIRSDTVHPLAAPNPAENVTILVADDDASFMALLMERLHNSVADGEVLQAGDGGEAVQLGLQHHPQIALLDVRMPRLGGIEAALILHRAWPAMEIALHSDDPEEDRVGAAAAGVALLDKRELEQLLAWIEDRAGALITLEDRSPPNEKPLGSTREQRCLRCGYCIACRTTPTRCPMCQTRNPWVPMPERRPESRAVALDRPT